MADCPVYDKGGAVLANFYLDARLPLPAGTAPGREGHLADRVPREAVLEVCARSFQGRPEGFRVHLRSCQHLQGVHPLRNRLGEADGVAPREQDHHGASSSARDRPRNGDAGDLGWHLSHPLTEQRSCKR